MQVHQTGKGFRYSPPRFDQNPRLSKHGQTVGLQTLKPRLKALQSGRKAVAVDSWRDGLSSAERGYDGRWRKAREAYLVKHPLCAYCQQKDTLTRATVVDHIIPHRGDKNLFWDSSNWQPLCSRCHDTTKKREEAQKVEPYSPVKKA